ncbi:hypothetical protein ABTX62_37505 [Streptomyces sp. NPDC096046]|uniref:hypothetical protein n=1 Tax=Streptomyces sp. NPDC096046 TaxID=3155542 RepID=UPI00332E6946
MTWTLPEPMLSTPVPGPDLRPGWAGEPKWDGFRALVSAGRLAFEQLQNRLQRRGTAAARAAGEWPAHFVTGVRTGSGLMSEGINKGSQQVGDPCSRRPTTA